MSNPSNPHDTTGAPDSHTTAGTTTVRVAGAYHEVPIGMERLLGLAAVEDRLAEELERDPVGLADGCGITLEPTEKAMLAATPIGVLRRMLGGIRVGLAPPDRREFMQRAAVAVAALAAGGASAVAGCKKTTPDPRAPGPSNPPDMGTTPPDMGTPPPDMATKPSDAATKPPGMAAQPDAGASLLMPPPRKPPRYMDQIRRGISPRRLRPKRPPTSTGVRPR